MSFPRVTKKTQDEYENLLKQKGEDGFYRYIVGKGIIERAQDICPEIILLDQSDAFFSLARRTGNESYFIIGRVLRKSAHRLYRESQRENQRKNKEHPVNARFLNIVK